MGATESEDLTRMIEMIAGLAMAAGPAVAAIIVILIVLFFGTKYLGVGFTVGPKAKLIDDDKLSGVACGVEKIGDKIDAIERRVAAVEVDVDRRATRDELHDIRLAMARYEGDLQLQKQIATQTNATVMRIEGYMFDYGVARQNMGSWSRSDRPRTEKE